MGYNLEMENIIPEKDKKFRRNYYTSDDSGKVYILALLAPYLIAILLSLLGGAICNAANLDPNNLTSYIWFIIPYAICGQLAFFLVYFLYSKVAKISLGAVNVKCKIGWKNALICILIGMISLFGIQYFISIVDFALVKIGYTLQTGLGSLPLDNFGWFILNVIILALLPAICEELVFRGMVLSGLRKNMSDKMAIIISAAMFAIMHGSLQQLVYPFLLGLILAWLAMRTGSTFSGMIVHFVNNFIVVLIAYIQTISGSGGLQMTGQWWFYLLGIGLLLLTGVLIWLIDKFYFKSKNQVAFEKFDKTKSSIFVWMSIAVGIILLIFGIVWNFTQG